MLLRAYWTAIRIGTTEFPMDKVIEVKNHDDRAIRAAIRGGLLQVVEPPVVRVNQAGVPRSSTPSPITKVET